MGFGKKFKKSTKKLKVKKLGQKLKPISKGIGKGAQEAGKGLGTLAKESAKQVKGMSQQFQGITSMLTNPVFILAAGGVALFIFLKVK